MMPDLWDDLTLLLRQVKWEDRASVYHFKEALWRNVPLKELMPCCGTCRHWEKRWGGTVGDCDVLNLLDVSKDFGCIKYEPGRPRK